MNYSDFWLNGFDFDDDSVSTQVDKQTPHESNTTKLIQMSAARRAIANYVNILTGVNIPVLFNTGNLNYTDGDSIHIGCDITHRDKFDVAVGLALHEGSHILYTNMNLLKIIWEKIPSEVYECASKLNIPKDAVVITCKDVFNYIEDRYIDYMVYTNAPGYRGYYNKLYDAYFNASVINDALKSKLYRTSTVESYMFRLINLTNINTDLQALPGLYDIANEIKLNKINRLTYPINRLDVAFNVTKLIYKHVDEHTLNVQFVSKSDGNSDTPIDTIVGDVVGDVESSNQCMVHNDTNVDTVDAGGDTSDAGGDTGDIGCDINISKSKLGKIKRAFIKQKKFINGTITKKKIRKCDGLTLDVLEKSKTELINVGYDYIKTFGEVGYVECILVKNMTRELLNSDTFPLKFRDVTTCERQREIINRGICMGLKLGNKLQIRNEINIEKFSRKSMGKIDKRLLHEVGLNIENIFYNTSVQTYKTINFHISVDASSSMRGSKWNNAIKLCTTLAKSMSMLDNVHLTISFRTTLDDKPYIVIAYNSTVDKFSKIKYLFEYLFPTGSTPEGLCYEALLNYLPKYSMDTANNYFINISDGEPVFNIHRDNTLTIGYTGKGAADHTRKQVNKIKDLGYKIISYFISESNDYILPDTKHLFNSMYGSDAEFIDVTNLNRILMTVNKKMMDSIDI